MQNKVVEILLVEDSLEDAELIVRTLKKHNLANHLLHVQDGEEALNYLMNENDFLPRLILLDLKMPKVDGIEVLKVLKAHPQKKLVPVVVLTSSREERDIVESYRLGVNAYIVKPVDFEKFVKAIADIGLFWLILNQPPK
ncbi:MAG TPA: two-component system response regulator [Cytophagales bacterium]|nr:two-component system response regulator [Cytophagales bacterium]